MAGNNSNNSSLDDEPPVNKKYQIRGVNIGGWLVLERYITPYQFALTDCHVRGDFCWYPGQIDAPPTSDPSYQVCDLSVCRPHQIETFNGYDYPIDEYTLGKAFANNELASQWLEYHFENFLSFQDIQDMKDSGLTHVRVTLPHWILEDQLEPGEPWIHDQSHPRWKYFVRLCDWCRQVGLKVWPDIHTAPGSQNGFDNSGRTLPESTCSYWYPNPVNVNRSLHTLRTVTARMQTDNLTDVVTGLGLLNEPYRDCDQSIYKDFLEQGLDVVRDTLGPDMFVYVGDMFNAGSFNDWWLDPERYKNTYLDSHFYQVFNEGPRSLSPRQHVAYVCQHIQRKSIECCYDLDRKLPSQGVQRMAGEWSAALDTLPGPMISVIMNSIAREGTALKQDRVLSESRKEFLKNYIQAQMVTYETGPMQSAWFFWSAKMEGGAFAEWDYLRAYREGWMPEFPSDPYMPSEDVFGSCYDILSRTDDDTSIIDEFPDPDNVWNSGDDITVDDDVVLSHGNTLSEIDGEWMESVYDVMNAAWLYVVMGVLILAVVGRHCCYGRKRGNYTPVPSGSVDV